jgi:hypothetical protein
MMESQSKFIEVSFLKNVLFYWTKILSKPKNSLVRNCYDALKLSKDKCSMKLNWYRDFSKLLDTYGCSELIQNEPVIDEYCTVNSIRTEIIMKLAVVRESLIQNDILKMQSSIKMPFIKLLELTVSKMDYLPVTLIGIVLLY